MSEKLRDKSFYATKNLETTVTKLRNSGSVVHRARQGAVLAKDATEVQNKRSPKVTTLRVRNGIKVTSKDVKSKNQVSNPGGRPKISDDKSAEKQLTQLICGNILWKSQLNCRELEDFFKKNGIKFGNGSGRAFERFCGIAPGNPKDMSRAAPVEVLKSIIEIGEKMKWLDMEALKNNSVTVPMTMANPDPKQYFRSRAAEHTRLSKELDAFGIALARLIDQISKLNFFQLNRSGDIEDFIDPTDDELASIVEGDQSNTVFNELVTTDSLLQNLRQVQEHLRDTTICAKNSERPEFLIKLKQAAILDQFGIESHLQKVVDGRRVKVKSTKNKEGSPEINALYQSFGIGRMPENKRKK
jgi:hypothetical protein